MEVGRPPLRKSCTKKGLEWSLRQEATAIQVPPWAERADFLCILCKKPVLIRLVKDEYFCWSSSCLLVKSRWKSLLGRFLQQKACKLQICVPQVGQSGDCG